MQKISWPLDKLLKGYVTLQEHYSAISVNGLSVDSRTTSSGELFFALQGLQQHGLQYSQQAVDKGAAAMVWESSPKVSKQDLPEHIVCIEIADLQNKLGLISQRFYDDCSLHMHVIGVTGTDGKTSVSQFIAQALQNLKLSCGVIGTLGYGVYPKYNDASHTTPDVIKTHSLLHNYYINNVKHAVIEASSHGLTQGRLVGVNFNTAVFTNLGRDHMDYHDSMEDYENAKRKLFQSKNLENAVINVDDDFGLRLANEFSDKLNVVTYSIQADSAQSDSFIKAVNIKYAQDNTSFEIISSWGEAKLTTQLVGNFNVSNLLAVLGVLLVKGVLFADAIRAVESMKTVAGRLEFITDSKASSKLNPCVVIDYAHTPQALANVLRVLRDQCAGKLWCVFGCGGNRDQGKRTLMAEAVERYADVAVLTDDNPRFEDPKAITSEVQQGFSESYSYSLIHDRRDAISYAIQHASHEDIVLIAGKGHEAVQIIKGKQFPFDDKKIAHEVLQQSS